MKIPKDIRDFIIPAIDVLDGNVVRLRHGNIQKSKTYFSDPHDAIAYWERNGAKRIHLVDLNRASNMRNYNNTDCITNAIQNTEIPICLSGGLRTLSDIESAFEMGAFSISVATLALNDPGVLREAIDLHGNKVYVSIDVKDSKIWGHGWTASYGYDVFDFIKTLEDIGIQTIIYTDIERDGEMNGYDSFFLDDLLYNTLVDIIISGGIHDLGDIMALQTISSTNYDRVLGAIVGTALYEDKLN